MKRERNFKVYLNNPSMRAALFAPVKLEDSEQIGHLAESAIFSQWQHSSDFRQLRYARWKKKKSEGEVDIVYLHGPRQRPMWIGEIKWSDRILEHLKDETSSVKELLDQHKTIASAFFTSKTLNRVVKINGHDLKIYPSALYCYTVGRNITASLDEMASQVAALAPSPTPSTNDDVEDG